MTTERTGVILLNTGGPDSLESVRPFLYNIFSDRELIKLGPAFLQNHIARIIAKRRAPKSAEHYRKIGGKSPLAEITAAQAAALADQLQPHGDYHVAVSMRYWAPYPADALDELQEHGVTRLIVLTLFPHYSRSTTGSSVNFLQRELSRRGWSVPVEVIESWFDQPRYLEVLATGIRDEIDQLEQRGVDKIEVVYSAHSLPRSYIDEGDPYVDHIEQTIAGIEHLTGVAGWLCYQSRSGPVEWLSPSTPEMLEVLAAQGCKGVVMVPISFVSDHLETLYEINMLYRQMAEGLGMAFASSASLNTNPGFIAGLAELVLERR